MPFWQQPKQTEHHTNLSLPFRRSPERLTACKHSCPVRAVVRNRSGSTLEEEFDEKPEKIDFLNSLPRC